MSYQPPSEPHDPWKPPQPYGPPADPTTPPVSGQPWSTPSGDPLADRPATDPAAFRPAHPPTSQFPAYPPPQYGPPQPPPGYGPPPGYVLPGYAPPGHNPPPPPPRRSNVPLIAVILAVTALLCGGVVTAGVLVFNTVRDRTEEAIKPITEPTVPNLPTDLPDMPTDIPGLPTDLPGLPTDLPGLPTGLPNLPGGGEPVTVVYEVTGDGPAEIVYTEKLGETPKRIGQANLPWKTTTTMEGVTVASVSAIRTAGDEGKISCRATIDGKEVATGAKSGPFAAVTCNKIVIQ